MIYQNIVCKHPDMVCAKHLRKSRKLGFGAFAEVYDSPYPGVVWKTGCLGTHGIRNYLRYVSKIQKYKNNPFFPKIYGIRVYSREPIGDTLADILDWRGRAGQESFVIVAMEKLEELPYELDDHVDSELDQLESMVKNRKSRDTMHPYHLNSFFSEAKVIRASKSVKEVVDVLRTLKAGLDLHTGNTMLRGTQVVLTDPVC